MDAADELGFVRERFVLPDGKIYLDGECPAHVLSAAARSFRCSSAVTCDRCLHLTPVTAIGAC